MTFARPAVEVHATPALLFLQQPFRIGNDFTPASSGVYKCCGGDWTYQLSA
jgi:hypothetical protein